MANGAELKRAIEALRAYSLVQRNPHEHTFSIHRLVQAVIQDGLEAAQARQWAECAVRLVNRAFPDGSFATWERCEQLMPHVLVCADHSKTWQFASEEAGHLFHRAGEYFALRAQYGEVLALFQRALAMMEQVLGANHPSVATRLHNLAHLHQVHGRSAEALPLFERALSIRKQALGSQHPKTAETIYDLARLREGQGHHEEARSGYERALAVQEQALGADHPKTVETRQCLLAQLWTMGQHQEAARLDVAQAEQGTSKAAQARIPEEEQHDPAY